MRLFNLFGEFNIACWIFDKIAHVLRIYMKNAFEIRRVIRGFTLIELMIVLVIMGVLITLAAPSFSQMWNNNRITAETNGIVADLASARSEALKLGGASLLTVCASTDSATCSKASDWSAGRLVVVESDPDGSIGVVDPKDIILRKSSALDRITATLSGVSTTGFVTYRATGAITSSTLGKIVVCKQGYIGREITISVTGRTALSNTTGNCT